MLHWLGNSFVCRLIVVPQCRGKRLLRRPGRTEHSQQPQHGIHYTLSIYRDMHCSQRHCGTSTTVVVTCMYSSGITVLSSHATQGTTPWLQDYTTAIGIIGAGLFLKCRCDVCRWVQMRYTATHDVGPTGFQVYFATPLLASGFVHHRGIFFTCLIIGVFCIFTLLYSTSIIRTTNICYLLSRYISLLCSISSRTQ